MSEQRDYVTEMRELINLKTASDSYVAAVAATEIVDWLRHNDPELLSGWLNLLAPTFIRKAISQRDAGVRTYNRSHAPRSVFAKAMDDHEGGDKAALVGWLETVYVVDAEETRRPLGNMTQGEVQYVAVTYEKRARHNHMQAAFLEAIAKNFKIGVVADHFDNEELDRLWKSLND